ncbi:hypothetical protein [Aquabacter cavernae]|uniref:hypothetical protein n=1 Tax=Aquabacter cavernae TaxID=2496029 RepID=UPI001FE2271C|nr:hypothetical protein [Aquabacter cavernae]
MPKPDLSIEDLSAAGPSAEGPETADRPAGARLRCDLCGSRAVRVVSFASPIEALRFTTARR